MPSFPQPGLERRWKSLPGQPVGDGGDPYTGYDRFGRTEAMLWGRPQEGGGFEKLVEVQWGYDRASLKTWRKDLLAPASTGQDQHFGYDGLYQVTERQRGLLNTNASAIGGIPAQQEDFNYDETGNWVSYRQANTGELDIEQSRVNNRSNQVTQVDGSSSGLSYDRNGNMLTVPTGEGLTGPSRKLVWDAWNRLVEVRDAEDAPIASYQYDAATRRTVEATGAGESAVSRHFYYNDQWRSVEERLDTSTEPERQHVWHPSDRYELLLRDRSTGNDGQLDERLYPMKDQLDPVALCDATGTVVERYAYSAFGMPTFLNADFTPVEGNASPLLWNFLFHAEFADPGTGWFNYGYRYYLPDLGRWPSRDPIGERGGVAAYGFVDNSSVNWVDAFGLKGCKLKVCIAQDEKNQSYGSEAAKAAEKQVEFLKGQLKKCTNCCCSSVDVEHAWSPTVIPNNAFDPLQARTQAGQASLQNLFSNSQHFPADCDVRVIQTGRELPTRNGQPPTRLRPGAEGMQFGNAGSGGAVIAKNSAETLAHELGHLTGYNQPGGPDGGIHSNEPNNLMGYDNGSVDAIKPDAQWCKRVCEYARDGAK